MVLQAYNFLPKPLREADAREGDLFLQRLVGAVQQEWDRTRLRIAQLPTLWSPLECEDAFLPYLRRIVGWTPDLDYITDRLSVDLLRRLIVTSWKLWRDRGPEDTMLDVLRAITASRARVVTWFDRRCMLGEMQWGEDGAGYDLVFLHTPGWGPSEFESNLRIVDSGSLDRRLVLDVVDLMRGSCERVEVTYLRFLDLFEVPGDYFQWTQAAGTSMLVANNKLTLSDPTAYEVVVANVPGAAAWAGVIPSARVMTPSPAAGKVGIVFHWTDALNFRIFAIDVAANTVRFTSYQAGAPSVDVVVPLAGGPLGVFPGVHYFLRAEVACSPSGDHVRCYLDSNPVIEVTDTATMDGTAGLWHDSGQVVEATEFEVAPVPFEADLVTIS